MKYLFLSLYILLCLSGFSQSDFKHGYIIKNDGDTLHGFLESRNLKRMGVNCVFKTDNEVKTSVYSAKDLIAYRFKGGKYYVSKIIGNGENTEYVFLEYLVDGKADLYYYKDESGERFFIQNENGGLKELKDSEAERIVNGRKYVSDKKEYIATLSSVFKDCPEIQANIEESHLDGKSLITLTKDYHNYVCNDYECITYNRDVTSEISIGGTFGLIYPEVQFTIKDDFFNFFGNENFEVTPSFNIGFLVSQSNIFGLKENFTFNLQTAYRKNSFVSENFEIKHHTIYLPVYLTYHFSNGNLSPIMNFGIGNSFSLHSKVETSPDLVNRNKSEIQNAIGGFQLSGLLGIGVQYKKDRISYLLFSNYEIGSGIVKSGSYRNNYFTSKTKVFGVNFGIKYMTN